MRNTCNTALLVAVLGVATSGSACHSAVHEPVIQGPSNNANGPRATQPPAAARNVNVNGAKISIALLADLERRYQLRFYDGDYWYDPASGACGVLGGPVMAFIIPGLTLGGALAADASAGNTGVFINGRELPQFDLIMLTRLIGFIVPGRYYLDANGNAGFEGGPPLANLIAASRQAQRAGGGDLWYSAANNAGSTHYIADGFVIGRDKLGNNWLTKK